MFDWVDMFWSRCRKFGLGLAVVCALCSGGVAPVQALPLPGGEVELAQGQGESQQESEQIPESSEESSGSVVQNSEDAENSSEASVPEGWCKCCRASVAASIGSAYPACPECTRSAL